MANRRGSPVGVVHTVAGLLVYCHEVHTGALGLGADDVIWTPTELGWIAGQTHGLVGPLSAGGTAVLYEGMLDTPTRGRAWEIIQRYQVNTLVATPSVVRSLRRWGDAPPTSAQVSSLGTIVTAGEAIDEDTLTWLTKDVGRDRIEVTNAWGQTQLGGLVHLDPPLEGRRRLPTAGLAVVDDRGEPVAVGEEGDLVLTEPWPAASPAFFSDAGPGVDPALPGLFVTGDRARHLPDGSLEFLGRSDRVFNISGQLVSATEIRNAIEAHPFVERAEVVDRPDTRTGQAVVAAVSLAPGAEPSADLAAGLRMGVREVLGGLAQPQTVVFVDKFPDELTDAQLIRALQVLCIAPGISGSVTHLTTSRVRSAGTALHY